MQVALIADTPWLEDELAAYRHLVVGLIDEQIRVAQVVPSGIAHDLLKPLGNWLTWRDSRWKWLRKFRIPRQADPMHELGVDLVHALDGRLWEGTLGLARRLNAALVLTSTSASDVPPAVKLALEVQEPRVAIAAGTQPLSEVLQQQVDQRIEVHLVRPGVHMPAEAHRQREDSVFCAVVSGTGRLDVDYECLFVAIQRIVAEQSTSQFFLDGLRSDQHPLWKAARRFGLLGNISLVPRALGHRELLLGTDTLIHPQALHRTRGLTLQAMACGLPVLARTDPWLDYLIDDQTAWLVEAPSPDTWYELIRRVMYEPARVQDLGKQARQWVRQHHLASEQVARTLDLYRSVTGESLRFPQGA